MREAMGAGKSIGASVALKGGEHALIERTTEADAPQLIQYLEHVAGESDFLSFGPGEVGLSVEQEAALVRRLHHEGQGVMLKASVNGELAARAPSRSTKPSASSSKAGSGTLSWSAELPTTI